MCCRERGGVDEDNCKLVKGVKHFRFGCNLKKIHCFNVHNNAMTFVLQKKGNFLYEIYVAKVKGALCKATC